MECIDKIQWLLADRSNRPAIGTALRPSVVVCCRLSVCTECIVAKRCVLAQKLLLIAYRNW